ncbi:NFACT family protein [Treponema sp.]|uniref:NFACT family protein n=1 Tax=Treponema sp. TaxID=166 RepID=UPI0025EC8FEC|nr:NFACT family protein [Treponema sp.]MCR5217117.1 NFACT family protein [Treponema sp.]
MSLNCNEINIILSEINAEGAFIQEITQTGFETLGFRIVNKGDVFNMLICTTPSSCRLNITQAKFPKNTKPLRFNEFLKSRVQGMRINKIYQTGLDRIVKMDVSTWKERLYLYIRLWSGAANVIVTDEEGKILDCMYRRPKKGEVSGGTFCPEEKEISDEEKEESLKKFPVREYPQGDKAQPFNSFIDEYYTEHAQALSRESLLAQAEKWFNVKHSKMTAALENLLAKKEQFENADRLKHTGDLILAFQSQINGSSLTCTDYESGKEVCIRINPDISPQENAGIYYDQYKKARSGLEALEHDIEMSRRSIEEIEAEYNAMLKEKNVLKLEQLLRKDTAPKQKAEKAHPGLHYELDGWTIMVGRTANENDDLLRHYVKGNDLWMHTRDFAGGYVFIKARSGKSYPLETMLYAGNLAVWHSKARKNGQADLYYTQVKHLRRAKNGPKGLVLPTNEKNLLVKLDEEKLRKLDEVEKFSTL